MASKWPLIFFCLQLSMIVSNAQIDSLRTLSGKEIQKYEQAVSGKVDKYRNRIEKKTEKTLSKLVKWEHKLEGMLHKVNPEMAQKIFGPGKLTFKMMQDQYRQGLNVSKGYLQSYSDYRDRIQVNLRYIHEGLDTIYSVRKRTGDSLMSDVRDLEKHIVSSEILQKMIRERKDELVKYSIHAIGSMKMVKKISKEAYYYAETLRNYHDLFNDQAKIERAVMSILANNPEFNQFFSQQSQLSGLFNIGSSNQMMENLNLYQTQSSVQGLLNRAVDASGVNPAEYMKQQFSDAREQISRLKEKALKAGSSSGEMQMPDFKPNNQKSKIFRQRLEYGCNVQFERKSQWIPGGVNIAGTIGYKLNDKSIIGMGLSYRAGFGSIQRIRITHEGIGLRSFIDWKLKKQFYVTGGFELNHQSGFKKIDQLKELNAWQQSGLIGLTKKYKITKSKKGNLQILWDFMSYQQVPRTPAFIYRLGYTF